MSEDSLAKIVGANIVLRRKNLGLSQKELAAKLDIGQESMVRMEKGRIAPKMGRLQDIATVLQCSVASLFIEDEANVHERAMIIADLMASLPPKGQEAVMNFVLSAVNVIRAKDLNS